MKMACQNRSKQTSQIYQTTNKQNKWLYMLKADNSMGGFNSILNLSSFKLMNNNTKEINSNTLEVNCR